MNSNRALLRFNELHVVVRAEHIDGAQRDTTQCPFARALHATTGIPWQVGPGCAWPLGGDLSFRLPDAAVRALRHWDEHRRMKPLEFDLLPPLAVSLDDLAAALEIQCEIEGIRYPVENALRKESNR